MSIYTKIRQELRNKIKDELIVKEVYLTVIIVSMYSFKSTPTLDKLTKFKDFFIGFWNLADLKGTRIFCDLNCFILI